jgi:glycosyltransferase involved in cell wall biosynthesis
LRSQLNLREENAFVGAVAYDLHGERSMLPEVAVPLPDAAARSASDSATAGAHVRRRQEDRRPSDTKRLLVVTHDLGYGGAQLYLLDLLRRLSRRAGFTALVLAQADGPLRGSLESLGARVHITGRFPFEDAQLYDARLTELTALVGPQSCDVALVNTMLAFPGVNLAERLDIPSVLAVHESYPPPVFLDALGNGGQPLPAAVREAAAGALGSADAVVFEADATRELYLGYADSARLLTLPYGIELDRIDAYRRRVTRERVRAGLGLTAADRVVLCMGTIEPRKGQGVLAEAFAEIAQRHPSARLVLAGGSSAAPFSAHLEAVCDYVERSVLARRVQILPLRAPSYGWYLAADLTVCASDLESLPRVVLEAMACETPVLATRIFGIPEVIEHRRTGYLCAPRDLDALKTTLDGLLSTPASELDAVAKAGAARVRERHDPDHHASSIAELLAALAADRDPAAGLVPAGR